MLTQTVTVAVAGDTLDEPDESFFVNLTGSSPNVSIADPQGQGTILDDGDGVIPPPDVSIDDVSVSRGRRRHHRRDLHGLARERRDRRRDGRLRRPPTAARPHRTTTPHRPAPSPSPQGVLTQTVTVAVAGDTLDEPDESFFVNLTGSSANVVIADTQGRGTIVDDEAPPPTPAKVTLSPVSATNTIGEEHCVTATVTDGSSNTMAGVTVRFSVSGANSTGGSDTSGPAGEARFCYTGASPGDDTIGAFADTDGNGTRDASEPEAEATKRWTAAPPAGVPGCDVEAAGAIKGPNSDKAGFKVDVESGARPEGKVRFNAHGSDKRVSLKSTGITEVLISDDGRTATIVGQAKTKNGESVGFRVDLEDLPRVPDTFRIRLSNGYDTGAQTIHGGGADIECRCEVEGAGDIKAANGDSGRFSLDVNSIPARGRLYFKDRGPARPFELESTATTQVTIGPDMTEAVIQGKAKINGAGSFDFSVHVTDVRRAPDSFRIRVSDYDSGAQRILSGDLDIECGDSDHDGGHGHGKDKDDKGHGGGKSKK